MTREDRKKKHRQDLCEKLEMLRALVEEWSLYIKHSETYRASDWAELRDLKRRKRAIEVRIKAFSL